MLKETRLLTKPDMPAAGERHVQRRYCGGQRGWERTRSYIGTSRRVPLSSHFLWFVVRRMDLQLVRELRNSIRDCSERGLVVAGKWYIVALHRMNLTLKAHHPSGLPSFISRYHSTNETRLLLIHEPDSPPRHPHARTRLALRLYSPAHQRKLLDRLSHLGTTKPPPSHPRIKNAKPSSSRPKKLHFLQPSRILHPKT